jgi:hypothetical protein
MEKNHMVWMALACAVPMLFIVILQFFGLGGNYLSYLGIGLMVILHIGMMFFMKHDNCSKQK